ncbi:MAG: hypothetical protein JSW39_17790 [Desulfobacterales bacterium]|nr:MAG: hypothetical protein JSW39_17790 [Desulfobacterales bacterium]
MEKLQIFTPNEVRIVDNAVAVAEELVSDHYKMSASQWLRPQYDIKTLVDLSPEEIVHGPFAQIIRYEGHREGTSLGSATYDFYKVCLQDHTICAALQKSPALRLFPFCLYIVTHELIHIVRFSKFLQNFDASPREKLIEEKRVHENTHQILDPVRVPGITAVLKFYHHWRRPLENLQNPAKKISSGS